MKKIAVVGLGYVGLPLARLFATKYQVVGFDVSQKRIDTLKVGKDNTLEISENVLKEVLVEKFATENGLLCSSSSKDIED